MPHSMSSTVKSAPYRHHLHIPFYFNIRKIKTLVVCIYVYATNNKAITDKLRFIRPYAVYRSDRSAAGREV